MKKLLLFAFLVFGAVAAKSQGIWVSQATSFTPVSSGVRYISVVDTNVVWICSYDGSGGGQSRQDFSRTIDGGTTWVAGSTPASAAHDWSMIHAISADTAWAMLYNSAAAGGDLYKTTDGGTTWNQQGVGTIFSGATSFPNVVHFWDANNGFVMGDPSPANYFEIHTTNDGGATWTRVPAANIPVPLSGEYGIVGHYSVIDDNVWFDTNRGRVYRSTDRGQTWTVASTGITVPTNSAIDICFYSPSNGIARLYNSTTGGNSMRVTSDSGLTWTIATPVGNFFGSDVKYVPGTASKLVSTGAATGFVGSSYSDDGGLNWIDIETNMQRTALGIVDSTHMWTGGFTTSPTEDGIFKYQTIPVISCADSTIATGTVSASALQLCGGDTAIFTATGVVAPTVGDYAGVSWVITTADISNSPNPQLEPSLVASYTFTFPAPAISTRSYINDGSLIGTATVPYGTYYWTPVVFGNALSASMPVTFLSDLTLDATCLQTGTSIAVDVLDPASPACQGSGISEVNNALGVSAALSGQLIDVTLRPASGGPAVVEVFDMSGRKVGGLQSPAYPGVNHIFVDASTLTSGVYVIKVQVNGTAGQTRIAKL